MAIKNINEEDLITRREMAKDPHTSSRTLQALADSDDTSDHYDDVLLRTLIANNPNCSESLRSDLSGRTICEYLIDVYFAPDSYSGWNFSNYTDEVHPYFSDYAVVISDNFDSADTEWWMATDNFLSDIWDALQVADDFEMFQRMIPEEYATNDFYSADKFEGIYDLFEDNYKPEWSDPEFIADAVCILYPDLNLVTERISSSDGRKDALVVYDPTEIDEDLLRDWLFGDVYDLRLYQLDYTDIPLDVGEYLDEYYLEYGAEIASEYIPMAEKEKLSRSGLIYSELPKRFGLTEAECEVWGDI